MSVILATWEAEIRRIRFQSQGTYPKSLSEKYPPEKRAGEVAQGVGPEFKP
jgi:hypothetical protein